MKLLTPRTVLLLLGGFGLALLTSGLVMEYGFGILPCPMCWWQRYAHAAIALAALLSVVFRQEKLGALGAGLAAAAGFGVAAWQVASQQGWLPYPASCAGEGQVLAMGADLLSAMAATQVIPCDLETFTLLGFSLAAWNLPAMALALGVSTKVWLTSR